MRRTFSELRDLEHYVEEKPDAEILQKLRDAIELEDIEWHNQALTRSTLGVKKFTV